MLELKSIAKRYGRVTAISDLTLDIKRGEFFALLGPSGCGKTTLLRLISGIVGPDSGQIFLDQRDITKRPPQERDCALVFQHFALLPHLNVFENVAFPLAARNYAQEKNLISKFGRLIRPIERQITAAQVHEVYAALAQVRLQDFNNRRVQTLSGGEAQRIALARALAMRPKILLMDEPFANLDRPLKKELRQEIKRIHQEVGCTLIYVTHDQEEAFALVDRVAIMRQGRLEQLGSKDDITQHPINDWVAKFIQD